YWELLMLVVNHRDRPVILSASGHPSLSMVVNREVGARSMSVWTIFLKGIESGDCRVTQRGRVMVIHRRELLRLAGSTAAVAVWPQAAWADTYPSHPVRILVGYAAGGGVDIAARLIGQWLSERFQQQFVVENRTGAATNIATEAVVRSPPDGYTLLLVNAANAINATYYESLTFNFMRDIAPVAGIGRFPYFMAVNPAFPASNVREFIAYAKANPRKVNMGTGGAGGPGHASGELLQLLTRIQMTHVPYRGRTPALTDLVSGQVQMVFCTIPSAIQYVKAGTLRAIAVTSATRLERCPKFRQSARQCRDLHRLSGTASEHRLGRP